MIIPIDITVNIINTGFCNLINNSLNLLRLLSVHKIKQQYLFVLKTFIRTLFELSVPEPVLFLLETWFNLSIVMKDRRTKFLIIIYGFSSGFNYFLFDYKIITSFSI